MDKVLHCLLTRALRFSKDGDERLGEGALCKHSSKKVRDFERQEKCVGVCAGSEKVSQHNIASKT